MSYWNNNGIITNKNDVKCKIPKKSKISKCVNKCLKQFSNPIDFWQRSQLIMKYMLEITRSQGGYISRVQHNSSGELESLVCITLLLDKRYGFSAQDIKDTRVPAGATFPMQPHFLHARAVEHGSTIICNHSEMFKYHTCPGINIRNIYYYPIFIDNEIVGLLSLVNSKNNYSHHLTGRLQPLINVLKYGWLEKDLPQINIVNEKVDMINYFIKESGEITALLDMDGEFIVYSQDFRDTMTRICKCATIPTSLKALCLLNDKLEPLYKGVINGEIHYRMYTINTGVIEEHFEFKTGRLTESNHAFIFGRNITKEKQLYQSLESAKKELEYNLQSKDMYLSKVSHELKTPLNAINGFAQLIEIQAQNVKPVNVEYAKKIISCCTILKELIYDVITISTAGTGKVHLSMEKVECNLVITDVLNTCYALTRELSINIETDFHDTWYICLLDIQKFKSILTNLLSNAIKYNKKYGRVFINVTSDGVSMFISIKDTGIGIPRDQMKHIYEPFNRCGMNISNIEGTGMGMTITKCYVEAMRGEINISSEYGVGTEVVISFPLLEMNITDYVSPIAEKNETILYIEDNRLNYEFVSAVIDLLNGNDKSVTLHNAKTGKEGIEMLSKNHYKCIILDLGLPDMSGKDIFKLIKSNPEIKDTPIIIYTASMEKTIQDDLRRFGEYHKYLQKPTDINILLEILNDILKDTDQEK